MSDNTQNKSHWSILNWNMIKGNTGTMYTVNVPRADYSLLTSNKALNIQSTLKKVSFHKFFMKTIFFKTNFLNVTSY